MLYRIALEVAGLVPQSDLSMAKDSDIELMRVLACKLFNTPDGKAPRAPYPANTFSQARASAKKDHVAHGKFAPSLTSKPMFRHLIYSSEASGPAMQASAATASAKKLNFPKAAANNDNSHGDRVDGRQPSQRSVTGKTTATNDPAVRSISRDTQRAFDLNDPAFHNSALADSPSRAVQPSLIHPHDLPKTPGTSGSRTATLGDKLSTTLQSSPAAMTAKALPNVKPTSSQVRNPRQSVEASPVAPEQPAVPASKAKEVSQAQLPSQRGPSMESGYGEPFGSNGRPTGPAANAATARTGSLSSVGAANVSTELRGIALPHVDIGPNDDGDLLSDEHAAATPKSVRSEPNEARKITILKLRPGLLAATPKPVHSELKEAQKIIVLKLRPGLLANIKTPSHPRKVNTPQNQSAERMVTAVNEDSRSQNGQEHEDEEQGFMALAKIFGGRTGGDKNSAIGNNGKSTFYCRQPDFLSSR